MADKKTPLELVQQAAKEGRTILDLSSKGLTSLPSAITKLTGLTYLDLGHNLLPSLLPEITELTRLTHIDLGHNHLTSLPAQIEELTNLVELRFSRNQLTSFPVGLTRLFNLTSISLKSNQISVLPPEIGELTNLTSLDLSNNQLTSLPPEIAQLTKLTRLDLTGNPLTALPSEIGKLTNLTSLSLNSNQATNLPPEIANLTNLTSLVLYNIRLAILPPEIAQLTNLASLNLGGNLLISMPPEIAKLTSLTYLGLNGNRLTSLPREISELSNLTRLDLGANQLTNLPTEIAKLSRLTDLILYSNRLASAPPEIATLTNLTHLDLGQNQLSNLPQDITRVLSLIYLGLYGNRLADVPFEVTKLINLVFLDLRDNKLPIPPESLANPNDVKAIFAAIAGLKSGERLNEAKMLVVGDGKVGKSSVVERMIRNTFDPNKPTTLGVEINDEMTVIQSEVTGEGDPVKLNIWDFGGQEIQHATHQFFLTTRSLYLLVVDARKGDQISNIEYWLKLIESFGGASPIIVNINQIDQLKGQRPLNLDRKALQEKYNIRAFVETSCKTGAGIATLKGVIARELEQLKHVRDLWPREWLAVKRRLGEMKKDYIPFETYEEICTDEGLNDPDLRESLLGLLHDLGVVIRLPGETQVLNPRWVTEGVYGLLTSPQLVRDQGEFDLNDVGGILAGVPHAKEHYPPHTHRRLIELMRHFELCFEFTDRSGHYLIPRHLHDNELDIPWDDTDALKFQYHYDTLPDSVISRFIVRMNHYITRPYYWKNGAFVQSEDKNLAKIKADLVDRKIFISVIGKEQTRRAFLAVIRSVFDDINSNFKIEVKQMIPVPGSPDTLVSYPDLLAYEEMGEPQIVIPALRKKFFVGELLEGVEEFSTRMERRELVLSNPEFARSVLVETPSKSPPRILSIVVASPGDVQAERDVLPSVIEEVNRNIVDRGFNLVLTRWETDTHPGFHAEGPQGLIDPILKITDCDLLIGIFWKRFGTQTEDGKTGTEHEFNLAYEAWREKESPQIFVYFNQKPYTPKSKAELEQWGQVIEFKEKFPREGLWWAYKGRVQFEKLVRNHLMNYIRSLT